MWMTGSFSREAKSMRKEGMSGTLDTIPPETQFMCHSDAPACTEIGSRFRYWRDRIYLGIGELSLTWPVAAFLRSL